MFRAAMGHFLVHFLGYSLELKKIAQLKEQGIINEEEYAKMKADCLAKL